VIVGNAAVRRMLAKGLAAKLAPRRVRADAFVPGCGYAAVEKNFTRTGRAKKEHFAQRIAFDARTGQRKSRTLDLCDDERLLTRQTIVIDGGLRLFS
jgi:hypothetical protein